MRVFIPNIRNKIEFERVKAPKIDHRKWPCINLILSHLRWSIYRQLSRCSNSSLFLIFGITLTLMAATLFGSEAIRTMPVSRTPESNTAGLALVLPKPGDTVGRPVWIQFRIDGYALGADSQFERASEVANSKMGQTVHIIIDDQPYFAINENAIDPFNEDGYFYDTRYKIEVPFRLKDGVHTIRMFPARSFGESLKGEKMFQAINFYVGSQKGGGPDLSAPYLTYNEPSNQMNLVEGQPILLDFYISNTELSADGYKVRLTIDGKVNRTLSSWQPYYIYGLKAGRHTIQLELLDSQNRLVSGPFSSAKETITIH